MRRPWPSHTIQIHQILPRVWGPLPSACGRHLPRAQHGARQEPIYSILARLLRQFEHGPPTEKPNMRNWRAPGESRPPARPPLLLKLPRIGLCIDFALLRALLSTTIILPSPWTPSCHGLSQQGPTPGIQNRASPNVSPLSFTAPLIHSASIHGNHEGLPRPPGNSGAAPAHRPRLCAHLHARWRPGAPPGAPTDGGGSPQGGARLCAAQNRWVAVAMPRSERPVLRLPSSPPLHAHRRFAPAMPSADPRKAAPGGLSTPVPSDRCAGTPSPPLQAIPPLSRFMSGLASDAALSHFAPAA